MHGKMSYGNSGEELLEPAVRAWIRVVVGDLAVSRSLVHRRGLAEAIMRVQPDGFEATPARAQLELCEQHSCDSGPAALRNHVHPLDLRYAGFPFSQRAGSDGLGIHVRDQRVAIGSHGLGERRIRPGDAVVSSAGFDLVA